MPKFQVVGWCEVDREWTSPQEVDCADDAQSINVAVGGVWSIVHTHRIDQNGELGWFIQYQSDRGHLAIDVAIMFDKE